MTHAITCEPSAPTDASGQAPSHPAPPQPQRLLYVVSVFPALSETFIVREIQALVEMGVDVRILSLRPQKQVIDYPQATALLHRAMRPAPFLVNAKAMLSLLARQPGVLVGFQFTALKEMWRTPVALGKTMVALWRTAGNIHGISTFSPQLIHAAWATYPATVAWFLSKLIKRPFSFTSHAHDIFNHDHMIAHKLGLAALAVTISEFNVRHLGAWMRYPGAVPVQVVHASVNLPELPYVRHSRDSAHLLAVGRLVPMKGFSHLLDALSLLRDRGIPCHCTIIGEGPELEHLLRRRATLGLESQVELPGALPQSAVAHYMAKATVMVMPCVVTPDGSADGIPTVLMEAMASGLPVISTRVSGIPELILDGVNGRLIEPGDASALADAIEALLSDNGSQERFAREARHKVEREFDVRIEAARLLTHFGRACDA